MEIMDYLNERFRKWQIEELEKGNPRPSLSDFAEKLNVKQPTLSRWMNGDSKPNFNSLIELAKIFGSEVYRAAGMESDDADLLLLQKIWPHLSEKEQRSIREQAEKYYETSREEPYEGQTSQASA